MNRHGCLNFHCSYIWWQAETLSVWQGEKLIVVQDGVEILNPLGVNIAIEDDPLALLQFTSNIVYDPGIGRRIVFLQ